MSWFARADAHIHAVGCIAGVATYSADPDIPAVKIIAIKGFHVFVHLHVVADVDVDIIVKYIFNRVVSIYVNSPLKKYIFNNIFL